MTDGAACRTERRPTTASRFKPSSTRSPRRRRPARDFGLDVLSRDFDRGVAAARRRRTASGVRSADLRDREAAERRRADRRGDVARSPGTRSRSTNALYPPGDPARRFATPQTRRRADARRREARGMRRHIGPISRRSSSSATRRPSTRKAVFEKYFGAWTAQGPKPNVEPPPVPRERARAGHRSGDRPRSVVGAARRDVPLVRTDPDWALLQLANAALTGGFYSSLLYHDLREVHGYAYSVGSGFSAGKVRGTFERRATGAIRRISSRPKAQVARDADATAAAADRSRIVSCVRRRC